MSNRRVPALLGAGALVFFVLIFLVGGGATEDTVPNRTTTTTIVAGNDDIRITGSVVEDSVEAASAAAEGDGGETTSVRFSDLPTISLDELPPEAVDVLILIEDGGPYPYRQDDGVFQNREGILPDRERGHYREYTVETPGSSDRGARRIVAGDDGERYWTDDHYASFSEIVFDR